MVEQIREDESMVVAMFMRWDGVTAEQYVAARELVNWEGEPASGGLFHVAAVDEHGLHVTDTWESAEELQAFVATRLIPGTTQLGIPGEAQVEIVPVHDLFTPAYRPA
jgi:hypothetical protein